MGIWLGLGLVTYWIHGLLNNFLELDKGSVPYWGFTAIIMAIYLFHTDRKGNNSKPAELPVKAAGE